MTKKEIIFNNLIRLLKSLTSDGENFAPFYGGLGDNIQGNLLSISEDIEIEISNIEALRDSDAIDFSFEKIILLLKRIKTEFSGFPNSRFSEIFLIIELLSTLVEASYDPINLADEVNIDLFAFIELSPDVHIDNFLYYDVHNFDNSVVLLNLKDIDSISNFFETAPPSTELIFQLLSHLGIENILLNESKYVLIKKEIENHHAAIWACLAMHVVRVGKPVHDTYYYDTAPQISSSRIITSGKEYQQFKDTIFILSEYNEKRDLLDKYIRLYHVVENFMWKYPLVKLERLHAGAVFSIRDFQRMYDKIRISEISALTSLMKRICDEEYSTEITFSQFIFNKWQHLISVIIPNTIDINSLLSRLRITKKQNNEDVDILYGDIVQENISKYFSNIVYAFRNSLVHNRETEFHLTQETIINHPDVGDCGRKIIEHFLIPTIEEIVFFLIINENDIVWFENPSLILYNKD